MAQATYRHGSPLMVDFIPGNPDMQAGEVRIVGDTPVVAHSDIATGELGAVASRGGVYLMRAEADIAAGQKVYWDNGPLAQRVSVTAEALEKPHFGFAAPFSGGVTSENDLILVIHDPDGTSILDAG